MFRKSLFVFLLLISVCAVALAQDTANKASDEKKFTFLWHGDGSYLGITTQEVTRENFGKLGLREVRGVAVEKVLENSPAAQAGLQAGDVILKFNGEEVTSTRKLTRLIGEVAPDHKVEMTVARGGNEREISVTLGKRPVPTFENGAFNMQLPPMPQGRLTLPPTGEMSQVYRMPPIPPIQDGELLNGMAMRFGSHRQIGISVSSLTKQLGEHFGVADGKGLLINNVIKDSPADKAGLRAGDVIVEVDGKEVKGNFDLIRAISEKKEGDVSLTIIRDKNRQTVRVTPEVMKGANLMNFEDFKSLENLQIEPMNIEPMNIQPMKIQPMPKIEVAPFVAPTLVPSRVL